MTPEQLKQRLASHLGSIGELTPCGKWYKSTRPRRIYPHGQVSYEFVAAHEADRVTARLRATLADAEQRERGPQ